jgi:hypothetical protein
MKGNGTLPHLAADDLDADGNARLRVEYVPVRQVARWDRNPKRHDLEGLKEAFRRYGFRDAPIFDASLEALAAGNGRATALLEMEEAGEDPPRGIALTKSKKKSESGWWCMPVQMGVDASNRAQAEAFAIDHNNLTVGGSALTPLEVASLWNEEDYIALGRELQDDLVTLTPEMVEQLEMALEMPHPIEPEPNGPQVERSEELRQEWGVEEGQVWIAGPHLLACWDATDEAIWSGLVGHRDLDWCWTDPPYGVNYVGRTEDALEMDHDDAAGALEVTEKVFGLLDRWLRPGGVLYVAHPSGPLSVEFGRLFKEQGWLYHQTLTWVKNVMVMGHSDYHYQHEPIIYGWKPGAAHTWNGGRDKVTTLFYDRPSRSTWHPTMKPLELIEHCLFNSSKSDSLGIDPFMGSGSTIVAAHVLGRRAIGIDADPRYVAVTLQRMADLGVEVKGPEPLKEEK